jgi:predicted nucleic acid-binding protein
MRVDTDAMLRHLHGYPQATRRLDELSALTLSAVSDLAVLQGMRNKTELVTVKEMSQQRAAALLPVSEAITQRAIELTEAITSRHWPQMGDALIAANALVHGPPVRTAGVKHFGAAQGLKIEAADP